MSYFPVKWKKLWYNIAISRSDIQLKEAPGVIKRPGRNDIFNVNVRDFNKKDGGLMAPWVQFYCCLSAQLLLCNLKIHGGRVVSLCAMLNCVLITFGVAIVLCKHELTWHSRFHLFYLICSEVKVQPFLFVLEPLKEVLKTLWKRLLFFLNRLLTYP